MKQTTPTKSKQYLQTKDAIIVERLHYFDASERSPET